MKPCRRSSLWKNRGAGFASRCRKEYRDRGMLKGVYLTLLVGPAVPVPAPKSVVDALVSAQVNTGLDRTGFQLVFSFNKKSPLRQTMVPAGFFDPMITRVIL